ncbi:inositol 1,4,5-triphosphate receptor associated 1-like isoform X2 [Struthio camelus]|uniref:inositol 1,4,5-triphosphate receptor associated 1-like isoform X2 n=1 Tax=Struthio camelus TaxID=8801 RepID=UPI0036042E89
MKQFPEASLGTGEQEAQRLAPGPSERQSCRASPEPRRERQAELPGLLAPPDEGRMSRPQGGSEGASAGSEQSAEHVLEAPGAERQDLAVRTGDSDRTEEGVLLAPLADAETPEDVLWSFPGELSVLERLGRHRAALTEQDVEAAFAHLALAFSCDAFTLRQRVEVEKRARDAAEQNIQEELGQCRAALERLGLSCTAADSKETLERLQRSLAVLAAAIERATSAAEKLGAVYQEARMSRAAEVMVQHVENLKRHHVREHAELEEMKRLIQQNSRNRQLAETQDDTEPRLRPRVPLRNFQQGRRARAGGLAKTRPCSSTSSQAALIALQLKRCRPAGGSASPSSPSSSWYQPGWPSRAGKSGGPAPAQHPEVTAPVRGEAGAGGGARSYLRLFSLRRSERKRWSAVPGEPEAESDGSGPGAESEEPEQPELTSKELWRPWLFLPQHYGVLIWLLLLGLVFLFLIPVLELQKLQPVASPKA